ncbi:hypothetical protein OS493_011765 [Desmophyllum pertusum]|uniref:Uncharacterized protein n=1 Tax=Desmophyllum pertusum TaxID=174260 RepID=A0A9W9YDS5_9CNID|nr:hypothetical protein OS493_011765 [Desmophyllum pertusum]
MENHLSRRRSNYDKEMDQAFTLIFHNIKRLQDGRLDNDAQSNRTTADGQAEINPAMKLKLPWQRPRAKSDPFNGLTEGGFGKYTEALDARPKSRSFGGEGSPSQGRKVTFADDYLTAKEQLRQSILTKRPRSNTNC